MQTDTLIMSYAHDRTLSMIYALSNYGADAEVYNEVLRIAQRAKEDIDAGVDPGERLENINGKIVEL